MYRWELVTGRGVTDWAPAARLSRIEGVRLAADYCRYVLHLDSKSIRGASGEVAPWVPFLKRVREIVSTGLTRDRIVYYDAAGSNEFGTKAKAQGLLRQFAAIYRTLGAGKAAADIESDIRNLSKKYGSGQGRILLVPEDPGEHNVDTNYIGLLCLTRVNHWARVTKEPVCQLRYLWVNPMYQGEWIGKVLVQEGIRYAATVMKVRMVYAEVMPTLERAINLFRDAGFRAGQQMPEYSDRLMFELPVNMYEPDPV